MKLRLPQPMRHPATYLLLVAAGAAANGCGRREERALPVYEDAFLRPRALDAAVADSATHHIADFALLDQNGRRVTTADLRGRLHVAQFFFAHCSTMCPPMFDAMQAVHAAYPDDPRLLLVSFTLLPEADSVAALRRFADTRRIPARGWHLLTGDHDAIRALARESYFVSVGGEGDSTQHAGNLVLVDATLRIRGVYGVTHEGETQRLVDDIAILTREVAR